MTNRNAARILTALAMRDPNYEVLSAEYEAALSGAQVPDDFASRTLDLLRADPNMAADIDRYERNLSNMQTYGFAEVQQAALIAAALILLLRPHVDFNTQWDLKFFKGSLKFDTTTIDEKTWKPVLSVLSAVAKKASEALGDVSEFLDGQQK